MSRDQEGVQHRVFTRTGFSLEPSLKQICVFFRMWLCCPFCSFLFKQITKHLEASTSVKPNYVLNNKNYVTTQQFGRVSRTRTTFCLGQIHQMWSVSREPVQIYHSVGRMPTENPQAACEREHVRRDGAHVHYRLIMQDKPAAFLCFCNKLSPQENSSQSHLTWGWIILSPSSSPLVCSLIPDWTWWLSDHDGLRFPACSCSFVGPVIPLINMWQGTPEAVQGRQGLLWSQTAV